MKSIKTKYVPIATCEKVTCLCGETYTQHKITQQIRCMEDDVAMEDTGYRVRVDHGLDGIVIHTILQCPICGGFDLEYWGDKNHILSTFESGLKIVNISL